MSNLIFCQKLQKEGEKIKFVPVPGELGKKIQSCFSQEAWQLWLNHQTILINEYRLNMLDKEARKFLTEEMEKFFFGEGSNKPEQFQKA
jgi:Fe-S cluster biosynthesis and repair protein YggX